MSKMAASQCSVFVYIFIFHSKLPVTFFFYQFAVTFKVVEYPRKKLSFCCHFVACCIIYKQHVARIKGLVFA